ncbi:hypothetical protein [Staphylococcus shinii]|uniref:hypothetical protein n=1 Tax=Staphylococcus shinii TaxID=2912228 RepID=UPI003F565FFF
MTDLEKLKRYLTDNNDEMLKKYIKGYVSAAQITKDIGVMRNLFYAVDIPNMVEDKEAYEAKVMGELVKRINRSIPYESMRIDKNCLFAREDISSLSISVQKDKARKRRNNYEVSFDKGFVLVKQSKVTVWYRYYLMNEARIKGNEKPIDIARKYGMAISKIYDTMRFFEENEKEGRFLVGVSLEQQNVVLENIKMFESYQSGMDIKEISKKWNVEEPLIEEVIESLIIAKENLIKSKKRN